MKKTILLIGLIALMAIGVFAFTIGNNITQKQVDSLDIESLELSNGYLRDQNNNVIYDCEFISFVKYCSVYANITSIKPNYVEKEIVDYSSYYDIKPIKFQAKYYRDLKNNHNLTYAQQKLKLYIKNRQARYEEDNTKKIEKYQKDNADIDAIMEGINLD